MAISESRRKGLTALEIKFLHPKDEKYDVVDIPGLYLRIYPNGTKTWRINKSIGGKRFVKSLGSYPDVSILEARNTLKEYAEASSANGKSKANTFGNIFRDFIAKKKQQIKHWDEIEARVNKYLMPDLNKVLWEKLTPVLVLDVIDKNVPPKLTSIKFRLCYYVHATEKFAVNMGRASGFKFQGLVSGVPKYTPKHMASIPAKDLPTFMAVFYKEVYLPYVNSKIEDDYWIPFLVGLFTLLRPMEYLSMKWEYIDLNNKVITIPAEIMKMKREHKIPISKQLEDLFSVLEKSSEYVFPQAKQGTHAQLHLFNVNFCRAFVKTKNASGMKLVPHGLRSIGRTWMSENGIDFEVAENCLAHSIGSSTVASYNRTTLLEQRRDAMQKWSNFIEECFVKSKIAEIE